METQGVKKTRMMLIARLALMLVTVFAVMVAVNYLADPANLYHTSVIDEMASQLLKGNTIESPGDFDEGQLLEKMVSGQERLPELYVLGSSRVIYCPWENIEQNFLCGGMSGSYLGDYYAAIGLMLYYNNERLPDRIIIGVDPWAFYTDALSGRHDSIVSYAQYAKDIIEAGESRIEPSMREGGRLKKAKELFSVAYFQASISKVIDTVPNYLVKESSRGEELAFVNNVNNNTIGEKMKILPNLTRIMKKGQFATVERNDAEVREMIASGSIYQMGLKYNGYNVDNLREFENLLHYLKGNNVQVDLYLPSWYPTLYDYFCENPDFIGVMELEEYLRKIGSENNIIVHGSFNPYICGLTKEDYADWLHLRAQKMMENYNTIIDSTTYIY